MLILLERAPAGHLYQDWHAQVARAV